MTDDYTSEHDGPSLEEAKRANVAPEPEEDTDDLPDDVSDGDADDAP